MAAALWLNGRGREADAALADLYKTHPEARDRAHMMMSRGRRPDWKC